jgi:lipopolysaccharide transport system ATP-binding protein
MTKLEIKKKFDEIVAFAEIEKFIDTPVKRYSSGMYVRLAFAVAAHLEPEILVVDEVLAVGDVEFQKKCLGKMSDVAAGGRTVLFVSHNMGAIESLCQKSILMEAGSISSIGDTKDIVNNYLSSTSRELETPIALRTDRRGTGKLIFDDIIVDDSQIRNRSLQVDLSIHNQNKEEYKNVLLSIVINDHLGRQLSNLVNYIIDKPIFVGVHGAKVRITIKNINLVPGTYSISPFVSSDKQNGGIHDWVINAAKFDVPDYDYYHKGHTPYIKGETIYMDYNYETIQLP